MEAHQEVERGRRGVAAPGSPVIRPHPDGRKQGWSHRRSIVAVFLALAAGAFPTARVLALSASPEARRELAGENPGASSINRVLGKKAAAAVLAVDVLKGWLPVTLGRAAGAGPLTVEALALAPMVGHVAVLKGRGGAALAGGVGAVDPTAFALLCPIWVGATIAKDNARGALVACLFYPALRAFLGRGRGSAAVSLLAPALLMYARLRGPGWKARPVTLPLLWRRLTYDAELPECLGPTTDTEPPENAEPHADSGMAAHTRPAGGARPDPRGTALAEE